MKYKRSRAEQQQILMEEGCEFFKELGGKHRYVGIYGDRRTKRLLRMPCDGKSDSTQSERHHRKI